MHATQVLSLSTPLLLPLLACAIPPLDAGETEDAPLCVPGQQVVCACPGGAIGAQLCIAEGSAYGTCECPGYSSLGDPTEAGSECDHTTGSTSDDDSTSTGAAATCGDGIVGGDEQCDDGNLDAADGCDPTCAIEWPLVVGGIVDGHAAIRYSFDDGATWHVGALPEPVDGIVSDLELGTDALLAIVGRSRVFRSVDAGASWTELELPIVPRVDGLAIHVAVHLDGRFYLGGRGQIAISDDDGATWSLVHDDPTLLDGYGRPLAYNTFARIGDDVIAGSSLEGPYHTLRSTDGGATWGDGLFSDELNMPGSGSNCATMRLVAEGGAFWAAASSICDDVTYDALDLWTNTSALSSSAWSRVTPVGVAPRFWGIGGDGSGDIMVLWGDGNYAVNRVLHVSDEGEPQTHALPSAAATSGYSKVRFGDSAWWVARGPVDLGESSVLRSIDYGASWSAIPETDLDQVGSIAVR